MANTRPRNVIREDRVVNEGAPKTSNKLDASVGPTKGTRYIPYKEPSDVGPVKPKPQQEFKNTRPRNIADQEITNYNANRKVRNVNLPRDIPELSKKQAAPVVEKISEKIADKVVDKSTKAAPATAAKVVDKVVKSAPVKSELDSYKSTNPALRHQFSNNSRLAQAVRSSDYGSDEDVARQARISEVDKFFRDRGVKVLPANTLKKGGVAKKPTVKKAKGGVILKPQTAKPLKALSSKSITQAAAGMKKAIKPAKPVSKAFAKGGLAMKTGKPAKIDMDKPIIKKAKAVAKMAKAPPAATLPDPKLFKAKGGAVKCSKSSKSINGVAKKGLTKGSKPKMR